MINIKTNVPSVENATFSSQQDLFDYVDSVPAGTYFIYIARQSATAIGIPGATSAAATAFFGHLMIFKRSNASIYIQHFPMQAHLPSYILIKDSVWQTEWKERSVTSGGGYKCSLSSIKGGGVNDKACRTSKHYEWRISVINDKEFIRFAGIGRRYAGKLNDVQSGTNRCESSGRITLNKVCDVVFIDGQQYAYNHSHFIQSKCRNIQDRQALCGRLAGRGMDINIGMLSPAKGVV